MSYFNNFIKLINTKFPLVIEQVSWNGTLFYMGGDKWNFNAYADWSIVNESFMIIGCHDDDADAYVQRTLRGNEVVDLKTSLDIPIYDPVFMLANGVKLKFFSTTIIEPWTMNFEDEIMFVASPSDKAWNILDTTELPKLV